MAATATLYAATHQRLPPPLVTSHAAISGVRPQATTPGIWYRVLYMTEVLDAVDRLRQAAGDRTLKSRTVRIGRVNAANSTLLVMAVQDSRQRHGRPVSRC